MVSFTEINLAKSEADKSGIGATYPKLYPPILKEKQECISNNYKNITFYRLIYYLYKAYSIIITLQH